ncbi:Fic family protein [Oceaniglobus ichthyenteri]|uniref:Fic family protein n=1 Tax=Oceaniglobus ichthyenteri TaxID=2136177 RepID=UPI000F83BC19|nr:Fic family protein [Oceaniglobus ichthyenteri]
MIAESNGYSWPNADAILDETSAFMESMGHRMVLNDRDAFEAGLERAKSAAEYQPEANVAHLAALMFDGIATRHALMDGNKRAGAIAALTFIGMNGLFLDVSENELEAKLRARVADQLSVGDLAAYFHVNTYPDVE